MSSRATWGSVLGAVVLLIAALLFRLGTDTSVAAVSSTMHARVGPGYEISLTFDDGSPVQALPAGTYTVLVQDLATDHNFHLFGPGVEQSTLVEARGNATWVVVFRANTRYDFQCDPHPDLGGRIDAGTVAAEAGGGGSSGGGGGSSGGGGGSGGGGVKAAPKTTAAAIGTIRATVDAAGLRLVRAGKAVKTLPKGVYSVVVTDRSKKGGAVIRRIGGTGFALTGAAFVGTKTVRVSFVSGQWKSYTSGRESATSIFFRVTK